jgi:hypothetical protein
MAAHQDLPVYLISGCPNPFAAGEPESFYTSDPGKALITGRCADFNRTKGPILTRENYASRGACVTAAGCRYLRRKCRMPAVPSMRPSGPVAGSWGG